MHDQTFHPEFHPQGQNTAMRQPAIAIWRIGMVPPSRLERLTCGLGNRCSIH